MGASHIGSERQRAIARGEVKEAYDQGFTDKCAAAGVDPDEILKLAGKGKLVGGALALAGSAGAGYAGGRKHQKELDKDIYGVRISKLLSKQRKGMKDSLSKNMLGR
jgi:hypothetical protein